MISSSEEMLPDALVFADPVPSPLIATLAPEDAVTSVPSSPVLLEIPADEPAVAEPLPVRSPAALPLESPTPSMLALELLETLPDPSPSMASAALPVVCTVDAPSSVDRPADAEEDEAI